MTNEEAIELIESARKTMYLPKSKEYISDFGYALEMAINVLEAQPCEDCISREALLDKLEKPMNWTDSDAEIQEQRDYEGFVELLKSMPSVIPKGVTITDFADRCRECGKQTRWIPVSKELPEENIHVLCQFYMGGMAECYHAHYYWHIVGGYRIKIDEVIAWMPLPQPYMAESEDKG